MSSAAELIAKARELCEKATPGPWYAHESHNWHKDPPKEYFVITRGMHGVVASWAEMSDASFIARSRTLIPALCDALEAAQEISPEVAHVVDTHAESLIAKMDALINAPSPQRWIPVAERLPENEQQVLICATRKLLDGRVFRIRSMAMYEDGTMAAGNSAYCWDECDFQYSEELDDYLVPQGWWEQPEYSETFCAVDDFVTHWIPLPAPPKGERNG